MAAALAAVGLCLYGAAPVSAAQSSDAPVVIAAQSDDGTEPDRRLVDRESSERIDAVVIALWSIAAGMSVMLVLFLWHTSPRRRLRLARRRATGRYATGEEPTAEGSETAEGEPGVPGGKPGEGSQILGDESAEEPAQQGGLSRLRPSWRQLNTSLGRSVRDTLSRLRRSLTPVSGRSRGELGNTGEASGTGSEPEADGSPGGPEPAGTAGDEPESESSQETGERSV